MAGGDTIVAPATDASAAETRRSGDGGPQTQFEVADADHNTNGDEENYPTGFKLFTILLAMTFTIMVVGIDNTVVSTAMPTITNHFKTTADIGWYVSAYRLTGTAFLFMFGKLYTVSSVKWTFLTSLVIFELGSLLCTIAPTSTALVVGRAVAGFGCSGLLNGAFTILTQTVPLRKRALYGGILGAFETIASICGPLLGGVLTDRFTWRACFGINLPLGAAAFAAMFFLFQDPRPNPNIELSMKQKLIRLDLPGTAIFVPSITSLLLGLQWGGLKYGWSDPRIIVLFTIFGLTLGAFFWLQRRQGAFYAACCNAVLSILDNYMSIYFQAVKGSSATHSGILLLPAIVGLCIACLCAGAATTAFGYYVPLMFLSTILGSIGAGFLTTLPVKADLARVLCFEGLLGFGIGLGIQAPQVAAQTVLAEKEVSIGISMVTFGGGMGAAISVVAAQAIFQGRLVAELTKSTHGMNVTDIIATPGSGSDVDSMGLADIRKHIGGQRLEQVLLGFDEAIVQTLYLPVALACLTLFGAVGMEWRSVKKKKQS